MSKILSAAAPIVGGFLGGPTGAAIGSAVGGLIGGSSGGGGQYYSGSQQQQLGTGMQAASASAFRPVGISTRFGQSNFQMGTDQYGNPIVTGAGYTVSPEIQALQDRLSALYGQGLGLAEAIPGQTAGFAPAAQSLFNLGAGYISQSPEEARQRIFNQMQDARLPAQMREEERLGAGVFGRGRAGLNIGSIGQPELYALGRAREAQRAADIVSAEEQAQQQARFGAGLFGLGSDILGTQYGLQSKALAPVQSQIGLVSDLEKLGLQPLEIGAQLGGRNVNAQGASALTQTGLAAAQTGLTGGLQQAASGQSLLNNFIGSLGGPQGLGQIGQQLGSWFGNPSTALQYGTNLGSQQTNMLAAQNSWF